jgi:hypothetical protein
MQQPSLLLITQCARVPLLSLAQGCSQILLQPFGSKPGLLCVLES